LCCEQLIQAVVAICPKYLGGPGLRPPVSLHHSSFFPSLSSLVDSTWVRVEPAHPLPNIWMQFMQSNSLIKFALMFNVLPGTEISVHATDTMDYKPCRANMAIKSGGSVFRAHLAPTLPESEGVRTPRPPRERRHWIQDCI